MFDDEFSTRVLAEMAAALDRICVEIPDGQDHATRARVAEAILESARAGHTSRGDLEAAGRKALIRPVSRSDRAT